MPNTPNFNEQQISGVSWERTSALRITNTLRGIPALMTVEEIVLPGRDGTEITIPNGNLTRQFDPNNERHMQIYTLLNEEVMDMRAERDAPPVVEEPAQ